MNEETKARLGVGGFILAFVVFICAYAYFDHEGWPWETPRAAAPSPTPPPREIPRTLEEQVQVLIAGGVVKKLDADAQIAWVEPGPWAGSSIDAKNGVAAALADYFEARNGRGRRAEIKDYRSGKTLARFGAFGLAVE